MQRFNEKEGELRDQSDDFLENIEDFCIFLQEVVQDSNGLMDYEQETTQIISDQAKEYV